MIRFAGFFAILAVIAFNDSAESRGAGGSQLRASGKGIASVEHLDVRANQRHWVAHDESSFVHNDDAITTAVCTSALVSAIGRVVRAANVHAVQPPLIFKRRGPVRLHLKSKTAAALNA